MRGLGARCRSDRLDGSRTTAAGDQMDKPQHRALRLVALSRSSLAPNSRGQKPQREHQRERRAKCLKFLSILDGIHHGPNQFDGFQWLEFGNSE